MTWTAEEFPGVEWIEGSGDFIILDPDRCSACARCVKVCLGSCFEIAGKKARVRSLEKCMECGACWFVCTDGAITFTWPAGGKGYRSVWG